MSLKQLVMPFLSARFLSRERLMRQRAKAEWVRAHTGKVHEVHYFHQVDDPYSALMTQVLPRLQARFDIVLVPHLVGTPTQAAAPERDRLIAYSRQDAARLARYHGLQFPDAPTQPSDRAVVQTEEALLSALNAGQFARTAWPMTAAMWKGQEQAEPHGGPARPLSHPGQAQPPVRSLGLVRHLAASENLRDRLGHYLGATLYYAGEWYWGVDRLYHLEQRLQDLNLPPNAAAGVMNGVAAEKASGPLYPPGDVGLVAKKEEKDQKWLASSHAPLPTIDFYFSLRSPYSAIVAERVFALGRSTGAKVNLRYLLPMVMRGLPVPAAKRRYIALDAAREAFVRKIPFGRINDPVGRPVERGLALMPLAEREGKGQAYVLSFMQGVWAQGLNAGSDRHLRTMAERAGLNWADAIAALADESWRQTAEANREELLALGLWGVPSFRVGDTAVWGQDRLWVVQQALASHSAAATGTSIL